jgi:hypothetical protein
MRLSVTVLCRLICNRDLLSEDIQKEYEGLISLGVEFSVKPTEMGTVKIAVFNDTCGNNIQIVQML